VADNPTPESFREALRSHKHTLLQLRRKVEKLSVTERANALLAFFVDQGSVEADYRDQNRAGDLLLELVPEPRQSLDQILTLAAPRWNLSVRQLPLYLREVFGGAAVTEAAGRLARQYPPDSREARALDTFCYWLEGKD
jgi:hypothetical protein